MRIAFFLAAMLYSILSIAQFPYNPLPWKQSDFKKIKELGYTKLTVYQQSGEDKNVSNIVEYGKDGMMAVTMEKGVNDNGDSVTKSEDSYKFDGKGRLIQIDSRSEYYGESITVYTYDATGKLTKKEVATIDPPTYKYKYDAKGRLIEVNITQKMPVHEDDGDWKGKTVDRPSNKYIYKYDAKGRLSEEWDYYLPIDKKTDPPTYKTIWTYNDKNQVIKVKRVNSEGTEMHRESYEYNSDGLISKATYNEGDNDEVYLYEYCKGCKQSWMP